MGDLTRQTLAASTGLAQLGAGRFFKLIEAQYAVELVFSFRGVTKRIAAIEAGYELRPAEPFDSVAIYNTNANANAIGVFVGEDSEDYDRTASLVEIARAAEMNTVADVSVGAAAVQIIGANVRRRRAIIKNNAASPNAVRIGPTGSITATRGVQLSPGATLILETTTAIYAIGEAAGPATISATFEAYAP